MSNPVPTARSTPHAPGHSASALGRSTARSRRQRVIAALVALAVPYALVAYFLLPLEWSRYVNSHPALRSIPNLTSTADHHPGDPLNVALIGTETELRDTLQQAGYSAADPLSLSSDLKIADATVLGRPYARAPVSHLYFYGRHEDLAFELPVGDSPRERHHVRFWKSPEAAADGRPFWVGQTSFDRSVGLSHTTGQFTHHIAADVDAERDFLFSKLDGTGRLASDQYVAGFHRVRSGRNGGGDPWRTDGRLRLGTIRPE